MFKVYNIYSGKTVKAGFDGEEDAVHWLDDSELETANYAVEEMDPEEEEEWKEIQSSEAHSGIERVIGDDEDDGFKRNFADIDDDDDDDDDQGLFSEFDPDDELDD